MSASPEFYRPPAPPAFPLQLPADADDCCYRYHSCRTPTGTRIREPTTCPPAPRKPLPCRKRLFHGPDTNDVLPLISLSHDELQRIFRPVALAPAPLCDDKRRRRRSARLSKQQQPSGRPHDGEEHNPAN